MKRVLMMLLALVLPVALPGKLLLHFGRERCERTGAGEGGRGFTPALPFGDRDVPLHLSFLHLRIRGEGLIVGIEVYPTRARNRDPRVDVMFL